VDYPDIKIHASLVEDCARGSSRAQFRLYKLYSKAMYNLAFRMMNCKEDAEDMLQEAFIECFRNIGSFRFESTFGAWLKSILINKCINQIRKRKPDLIYFDEVPNYQIEENDETVYDTASVIKGIDELPNGYRIILTLYLLEGYDHTEIAQILNISESTSKSQYSRAKEKLRVILRNTYTYGQS